MGNQRWIRVSNFLYRSGVYSHSVEGFRSREQTWRIESIEGDTFILVICNRKRRDTDTCDYMMSPYEGDYIGFVEALCSKFRLRLPGFVSAVKKRRAAKAA